MDLPHIYTKLKTSKRMLGGEPENPREGARQVYPERAAQIDRLESLLFARAFTPTGIFCYGPPATGKTAVIKHLLSEDGNAVIINCIETHTPRLTFSRILDSLAHIRTLYATGFTGSCACDSLEEFTMILHELCAASDERRYVVLDHIEKLRDGFASTLLPAMMKVSEVTQNKLVLIMISNQVWDHFTAKAGNQPPIEIRFGSYNQKQMLDVLSRDCPADCEAGLFRALSELVYGAFSKPCRDLAELRNVIRLLLPRYLEPITQGRVNARETAKLYKHIEPFVKDALNNLYLRKVSTADWAKPTDPLVRRPTAQVINLPMYTKFLLIAAFLASYNPPRFDLRFFANEREASKRRKGGKDKTGGKLRPQLVGPKAFPVERQMAIFHSIVGDNINVNVDLQIQNTSLISLRLLLRATAADRLDGIKCKCNVSYDTVQAVSKSVKFDVAKYLYDFA
ncbi:hypothetical protein SmJEL517_g05780 [Synchytrium microbalum]|uniref:Uncharacterized protein n=1 Tax=Synchytrium microbalum TaxID=1806994 RepID=A0A507BTU2_9FUNG|nr:uncharacterized protein SmJEL517_g05780 [Synchytrium microbalum]TPX30738.1 hypothetical protein SmJEL517_g05780 [Synchytrium microbalum]